MTTAYVENSQTTLRLYNERYRADAVLLREEIIERLPEDIVARGDVFTGTKAYTRYYLANSSGIIADIVLDLETLAKLLPEQKKASTVRRRLAALSSLFFLSPLFPLPLAMRGAALWMAWGMQE